MSSERNERCRCNGFGYASSGSGDSVNCPVHGTGPSTGHVYGRDPYADYNETKEYWERKRDG